MVKQSTRKKNHGLAPIIVLLRLAPRDCWLVVVLGQDEGYHGQRNAQRFCFLLCQVSSAFEEVNFRKMHVEFYVNISERACSAQESDENEYFLDSFLAHLQDQYLRSWRFCFAGNALVT
jgi:hypothetical protein